MPRPPSASSPLRLRPATAADLPALLALENRVFPSDRLSPRAFRYHLGNPRATLLVAASGGTPCGYALILRRGKNARLYGIAVDPASQGQGIGKKLLAATLRHARRNDCAKITLEVRARARAVIRLYESFGFTRTAPLPAYYGDGADGVRMIRFL